MMRTLSTLIFWHILYKPMNPKPSKARSEPTKGNGVALAAHCQRKPVCLIALLHARLRVPGFSSWDSVAVAHMVWGFKASW